MTLPPSSLRCAMSRRALRDSRRVVRPRGAARRRPTWPSAQLSRRQTVEQHGVGEQPVAKRPAQRPLPLRSSPVLHGRRRSRRRPPGRAPSGRTAGASPVQAAMVRGPRNGRRGPEAVSSTPALAALPQPAIPARRPRPRASKVSVGSNSTSSPVAATRDRRPKRCPGNRQGYGDAGCRLDACVQRRPPPCRSVPARVAAGRRRRCRRATPAVPATTDPSACRTPAGGRWDRHALPPVCRCSIQATVASPRSLIADGRPRHRTVA